MNTCTTCGYVDTTGSGQCSQCTVKLAPSPAAAAPLNQGASASAIAALVLGILSLLGLTILGPLAWMIGRGELQAIAAAKSPEAGRGIAKAGVICGIVGTVLFGIMFLHAIERRLWMLGL